MRQYKFALTLLAAAVIAGCGGGSGGGNQTTKVRFSSQVSFGDSLSDVGSYAVGTVAALRGGQFNINGSSTSDLTGKNWTQLMAAQFGLPAPCAAQTGLHGDAASGFNVPVVNHAGCTGYAQGGSRVVDPIGVGNTSSVGALTVPTATQIQNHLAAVGGKFKGDEVVFVLTGANDLFAQLDILRAGATTAGQTAGATAGAMTFASTLIGSLAKTATNPATAAQAIGLALATENARPGHTDQTVVGAAVTAAATQPGNAAVGSPAVYGPLVAAAQAAATTAGTAAGAKAGADFFTANAPLAVAEMGRLGAVLANLIKTQIVGNGANYVVTVNIPDAAATPDSLEPTVSDAQRSLIDLMVKTFNAQLRAGVASESKVLYVDAYTANVDQVNNPALHGLTNVKDRACDLSPAKNPLHSSLVCTSANLIAGDVSHYLFADGVHPTPFGYLLLARFVSKDMVTKGWL
jgi:phospholipase/lecithinase/hemolysin